MYLHNIPPPHKESMQQVNTIYFFLQIEQRLIKCSRHMTHVFDMEIRKLQNACNIEKHLLEHEFSDTLSCYNILLTCVSGNFESICLLYIKHQTYFIKIDHLMIYLIVKDSHYLQNRSICVRQIRCEKMSFLAKNVNWVCIIRQKNIFNMYCEDIWRWNSLSNLSFIDRCNQEILFGGFFFGDVFV